MTRKILLVLMLAATVVIVAEAIGQGPSGQAQPAAAGTTPSLNPQPGTLQPGTAPTIQPTTTLPKANDTAPKASESFAPATKTNVSPSVAPSSTKVEVTKTDAPKSDTKAVAAKSPVTGKDASAGKDSGAKDAGAKDSGSKTFTTSTSVPPPVSSMPGSSSTSSRRELVLERCLVTLIDDNKIPASEAGMITKMEVKEGNSIEKGFLVAEIDTRSILAKREIARSELNAALAQAENDAEVEVAEAAIQVALAELQQSEEIRRTNARAVSESQWRKDKFNYDKSLAQKKQALNEKKIAGLTANAKQAQFDAASIELDLRQVRAPFKGEVVEVVKKVGDWVTVGEPIMHIVGLDKVKVKGFVLVSGANGASQEEVIGKDVKITVEAAGGKKHTINGKIGFASPVIEGVGTSRQFRIWAEVDNKKSLDAVTKQEFWQLQPGSIATMTIDMTSGRPAVQDSPTSGKGKVESFKPVTGVAPKSTAKER